jgi:hypothetical protein
MMTQQGPTTSSTPSSPFLGTKEVKVDIELCDGLADSKANNNNNDDDDDDDIDGLYTVDNTEQQLPERTATTTTSVELSEEEIIQRRRAFYKKSLFAMILVGLIAFIVADSLTNGYVKSAITSFLEWIEANPGAGIVAFMLVYFVATVLFIPGSILTVRLLLCISMNCGLLLLLLLVSSSHNLIMVGRRLSDSNFYNPPPLPLPSKFSIPSLYSWELALSSRVHLV